MGDKPEIKVSLFVAFKKVFFMIQYYFGLVLRDIDKALFFYPLFGVDPFEAVSLYQYGLIFSSTLTDNNTLAVTNSDLLIL